MKQNKIFKGFKVQSLQVSGDACTGRRRCGYAVSTTPSSSGAGSRVCGTYLAQAQPALGAGTRLGDFLVGSARHWWLNRCLAVTSSAAFPRETSGSAFAVKAGWEATRCWLPRGSPGRVVFCVCFIFFFFFLLKELKPLSLFSWLFRKVSSDKSGLSPPPACQISDSRRCIGSKHLSPTFPLGMSVEDAGTACDLSLCL